jgi:hypothetical protein
MPHRQSSGDAVRGGRMLITTTGLNLFRLHSDESGETHLEDVGYSMATTKHGLTAQEIAAREISLHVSYDGPDTTPFETSPARQLVITLAGRAEVEATDGSRRPLEVGTILLAEDLTGKGHRIHELERPRLTLAIPLLDKKRAPTGLIW